MVVGSRASPKPLKTFLSKHHHPPPHFCTKNVADFWHFVSLIYSKKAALFDEFYHIFTVYYWLHTIFTCWGSAKEISHLSSTPFCKINTNTNTIHPQFHSAKQRQIQMLPNKQILDKALQELQMLSLSGQKIFRKSENFSKNLSSKLSSKIVVKNCWGSWGKKLLR